MVPKRPGTGTPLLPWTCRAGSAACPAPAAVQQAGTAPGTGAGTNGLPRRARTARFSWDPRAAFPVDSRLPGRHPARGSGRCGPLLRAGQGSRYPRGTLGPSGKGQRLRTRPASLLRRPRAAAGPVQLFGRRQLPATAVTEAAFQARKQKNNNRKHPPAPLFSGQLGG